MLDVLSYRDVSPAGLWDEVRDWLVVHGVPMPPQLAARPHAEAPPDENPTHWHGT